MKMSPPTNSAAATTNAATEATTIGGVVEIKSEPPSDEIKEYAENTMNELLGWYGFDGVDRLDLSAKNSRLLHHPSDSCATSLTHHHQMEKRRSRNRNATTLINLQQQDAQNNTNNSNSTKNNNNTNEKSQIHSNGNKSNANHCGKNTLRDPNTSANCGGNESTTSDHDTRSSREDDSKSPHSAGRTTVEEKIDYDNCCWCRRPVPENAPEFLTTTDGPRYCSESCFTQNRRASFKKAKTCDWCKHVRHAVSYVDFQDGASQLQFCSDKCLNQYKMQIFCKETQAHLDMNPHLRDHGLEAAAADSNSLITPDLWLRNCRSRSASPASTLSASPVPPHSVPSIYIPACANRVSPTCTAQATAAEQHKPLISVAPVAKLMSKSPGIMSGNRNSPKHSRKKRVSRTSIGSAEAPAAVKVNLRRELSNLGGAAASSALLSNPKSLLGMDKTNNHLCTSPGQTRTTANCSAASPSLKLLAAPSLSQFAAASVHDLHMSVPPLSPMPDHQAPPPPPPLMQHQHQHPSSLAPGGCVTAIPPSFFVTPPGGQPLAAPLSQQTPPQMRPGFPTRPPFMQNPMPLGGLPHFMTHPGFPPTQQPSHFMQPEVGSFPSLLSAPPPVTVMVPYPVLIPLPIPIPVPLPVSDFYRAHLTPEQRAKFRSEEEQRARFRSEEEQRAKLKSEEEQRQQESSRPHETVEKKEAVTEMPLREELKANSSEPLDFTKAKVSPINFPEDSVQSAVDAAQRVATNSADQLHSGASTPTETMDFCTSRDVKEVQCVERCNASTAPTKTHRDDDDTPNSPPHITSCASPTNQENTEQQQSSEDDKEKQPRFKITRLQTKRTLIIQTKESECSRPLRKRKRIIDCDFQKIELSSKESEKDEGQPATPRTDSLTTETSTKNTCSKK